MSNKVIYPVAFGVLSCYFYALLKYTIDFPVLDDYDSILRFTYYFEQFDTLAKKMKLLFNFHNEHIIILVKLLSLLQYKFLGGIDLRLFCYIGTLGSFSMAYLYYLNVRENKSFALAFCLVLFVTFLPIYCVTTWAMSAIHNIFILVFTFATFHFLQYKNLKSVLLSGFFQFWATFTIGGGFVSFFIGLFLLKSHKLAHKIVWVCMGVFNLSIFFYLYSLRPNPRQLEAINLSNISDVASYFFFFFGNAFNNFFSSQSVLIPIGAVIFTFILIHFFTKKKLFEINVIEAFLIYLILNITMAAVVRFHTGIGSAGAARYQPVCLNILLCISILYLNKDWSKFRFHFPKFQWVVLIFAAIFYVGRFQLNVQQIEGRYKKILTAIIGYECNVHSLVFYPKKGRNHRGKLHKEMYEKGYLKNNFYPDELFKADVNDGTIKNYQTMNPDEFAIHIDRVGEEKYKPNMVIEDGALNIFGWCVNTTKLEAPKELYALLDGVYYQRNYASVRPGLKKKFKSNKLKKTGYYFRINLENLETGDYTLQFWDVDHAAKTKQILKQTIKFQYIKKQ